jgi:hypothetical protein
MGLKLEQLIDRCMEVALGKGLSRENPITLKIAEPLKNTNTLIVVSYDEPHDLILPINVTWIDADPSSSDHKVGFKRESKVPAEGFYNTWVEVQTYDQVFSPPQFYSSEDLPVPIYNEESQVGAQLASKLDRSGDSMSGPLKSRTLEESENFDLSEMIPRSFLVSEMSRQTQGFYSLLTQFNRRLQTVQNENFTQSASIQELKDALATGGGGGGGTPGGSLIKYIHTQNVEASSWTIEHNLSNPNIHYIITAFDGTPIGPERQFSVEGSGENISTILFAEPTVGKVVLVSL